jgi:prolyl oligopeptidase
MDPRLRSTIAAALVTAAASGAAAAPNPAPPPTPVHVVRDTLHGVVIEDPYRWLEDKDSPETRAWVQAQMAFTQAQLAKVPGRDDVKAKLAAYKKVDTRSVPTVRGKRLFFSARKADQQQAVLTMREGAEGADVALVDPNGMGEDHTTNVALLDVSHDGALVAYGIRKGGEDETDVRLLDVATRKDVPGGLPKARYLGVAISPDKKGCWYSRWEDKGSRIRYHRFGDDLAKDKVVFGEGFGPERIPAVSLTDDGRWVVAWVYTGSAGDDIQISVMDAVKGGKFTLVTGELHEKVSIESAGGKFILSTTWQAPNGRVLLADWNNPGPAHWQEIVPTRKDAVIEGVSVAGGRLVVQYLQNVSSKLETFGLDGSPRGAIALPGIGSASAVSGSFDGNEGYYSFQSFNRPTAIHRYDFAAGADTEWWKLTLPFVGDNYEVRQITYFSQDGVKVPMFVTQPKGMEYDGSHPVLLTGYGGFNLSQTPGFSAFGAAWLDMGGVFVSTNLRGGGEFGDTWHQGGMRAKKQNTFDDFLGAALWLLTHGYCTRERLGIAGGSNGGLLVGAAITQRPDLFGAAVCEVPLLDMLRFHRFLVARFWVPEYGSSEDPEQFQWLRAYSPYQHVVAGTKYPATLFVSGDSDTRVDPLHARKMAALLQAAQGGDKPVLLHYDVSSGHSGGQGVDKSIEDDADVLQFLRAQLGMSAQN